MIEATAVIVNLTGQNWNLQRSYGTFSVRGCEESEPYTLTRVAACKTWMDLGDKRGVDVSITAQEVAQDLCREINADGGEDSFFGVFVAAGELPTEEELAQARQRLTVFYRRLVAAADREWERSHSYLFINDVERRAALYLGVQKEWFYWLVVAFTLLTQFCLFVRWLHRRVRDNTIEREFIRDMATNHLPHIYHALRQMADHHGVPLEEPPPVRFLELNSPDSRSR